MELLRDPWVESRKPFSMPPEVSIANHKGVAKVFLKNGKPVGIVFANSSSGQFGEFSYPFFKWSDFVSEYKKKFPRAERPGENSVKAFKDFLKTGPFSPFGVKIIPLTIEETPAGIKKLKQTGSVPAGTFTAEIRASWVYQTLVEKGIAFTPLFSKPSVADFDKKLFTSESILTLKRFQKTLKRILKDSRSLEGTRLDGYLVNEDNLQASLFSDKVGIFVTTLVGVPVSISPEITFKDFIPIIFDSIWLFERAMERGIFITDTNLGNVLYFDQDKFLTNDEKLEQELLDYLWEEEEEEDEHNSVRQCSRPEEENTVREYIIPGKKPFRIVNNHKRLTFIDLGHSMIESLEGRLRPKQRIRLTVDCRIALLDILRYLAVLNNFGEEVAEVFDKLNYGKDLWEQLVESSFAPNQAKLKKLEVSESWNSGE